MPRPNGSCSLTAGEKALSAKMVAAWDDMAVGANPGSNWPRYITSGSMGINVVGDDFTAGVVDYSMCDFWDEILAATSSEVNGTGSDPKATSRASRFSSEGIMLVAASTSWSSLAGLLFMFLF